jgi:phospholipid/cholesterol/gamma-HCH transport system permease protein
MLAIPTAPAAPITRLEASPDGEGLRVELAGRWRITAPKPSWGKTVGSGAPKRVQLVLAEDLTGWDSALLLFICEAQRWCRLHDAYCDLSSLPETMRRLAAQLAEAQFESAIPVEARPDFLSEVGCVAIGASYGIEEAISFIGECAMGAGYFLFRPRKFRWRDCLEEMRLCGADAVPIVSLISFLVGVTLAYTGAIVLRKVGGDIWIADLIGLAMVREMGAVMAAVVLAGRTGAAFAASLGNMKAGEEIDALTTFGIRPVNFLVLPRVLALSLMMPLLALYANALGILGGIAVALGILQIPPTAFWVEMLSLVTLSDIAVGVIKATAFGLLVGMSGCLRGLQAERSAAGVGKAATSAVVTALLLLIVADAIFAVLFNVLGW